MSEVPLYRGTWAFPADYHHGALGVCVHRGRASCHNKRSSCEGMYAVQRAGIIDPWLHDPRSRLARSLKCSVLHHHLLLRVTNQEPRPLTRTRPDEHTVAGASAVGHLQRRGEHLSTRAEGQRKNLHG